jgi:hypothetical protein
MSSGLLGDTVESRQSRWITGFGKKCEVQKPVYQVIKVGSADYSIT